MASRLVEDILKDDMKTNLDIPDGEIKIDGIVNPTYANAINVHQKKKKEVEKELKDKKPELKKPFLGTKGTTTIMPKTKEMKKLKLAESAFKSVREHYEDAPEAYQQIFRVLDNMEHIINYINELDDAEFTYTDMKQSYDVLEESMSEFADYLEEIKKAEGIKEDLEEVPTKKTGRRGRVSTADIWDRILAELDGTQKSIEAKNRIIDVPSDERYSYEQIGVGRDGDYIRVNVNDEADLEFGFRVANAYGVRAEVREHTSIYAKDKYELRIYPYEQVTPAAVNEDVKALKEDMNDAYNAVAKHFNYHISDKALDVLSDLVERTIDNVDDGIEIEEAVFDAIDGGLIYNVDIWAVKEVYEEAKLDDETYEELISDIHTIASSLIENDDVDEGLTRAERHNRNMDRIFQDKRDRDTRMSKFLKDNSDITDDELKRVQDGDKVGLELKNRGLHDRYWNEVEGKNESLKKRSRRGRK